MVNSKSVVQGSCGRFGKTIPVLFVIGAAVVQLFSPVSDCAVCQSPDPFEHNSNDDVNVELVRAREQANATQKNFETVKRLSEQGSVSQFALRRSDLQRKVALLDYSSLLDPGRRQKNGILRAEVILQFRETDLRIIQELYRRGSVSKVAYLRSVAARDIADSNFKAAKSASQVQRKIQAIKGAKSKYEMAQNEYEIANRLFESQSISQSTLDQAVRNLKIATVELEAIKQSLGARAVRVKQ